MTIGNRIVAAILAFAAVSAPVWADEAALAALFDQLAHAAPDTQPGLEEQIRQEWGKTGSPAIDLLLQRGREAIETGEIDAAIEHLTAAIDHAPDVARGYTMRAVAYSAAELVGPALDDLRQALVLEPRDFDAMALFGGILEQLDRPQDALETYRRILEINPMSPQAAEAVQRLELQLEGQTL